jgi:hypothetical protein
MTIKKRLKTPNYEKYTPEEQAEAYVFPANLTEEERRIMNAEMKELRMQQLAQMSKEEKIWGQILGLKYRMARYARQSAYNQLFTFGIYLQEYLHWSEKTPAELASEIQWQPAKLNLILSDKVTPPMSLMYRLEKHSGALIPALLWWQLVTKKMEYDIQNDTKNRKREGNKVRFTLSNVSV